MANLIKTQDGRKAEATITNWLKNVGDVIEMDGDVRTTIKLTARFLVK